MLNTISDIHKNPTLGFQSIQALANNFIQSCNYSWLYIQETGELERDGNEQETMKKFANLTKQRVIIEDFQRRFSLVKIYLTLAETTSTEFSPLIMWTSPTFLLQYSKKGMVCSLQVLNLLRMVSRLSSSLPLTLALSSSRASRVSSEHSRQMRVLTSTSSPMTFFQASQFSALLGKPSIRQILLLGPFLKMFLLTMSTSISLGANLPSAMNSLILAASSQSVLMNSLRRSPVEKWVQPYLLIMMSH